MGFCKESFNGEEACALVSEENVVMFHVCLCPIVSQFLCDLLFVGRQPPAIWPFVMFIIKCSLSVVEKQVGKANVKPTVLSVKLYDLGRKYAFHLYLFMCIIKATPCGRETF